MHLEFKRITSNDDPFMKDVVEIMDAQSRVDMGHHGPEGIEFHSQEFFVVSYLEKKPVGLIWCQAYSPPRKRIEIYQYITHPLLRNRRMPLYLTRHICSWAAHHGFSKVIIPNAVRRMQIIIDYMKANPRMIYSREGVPKKAENITRIGNYVSIRIRPRNSRRKNRVR